MAKKWIKGEDKEKAKDSGKDKSESKKDSHEKKRPTVKGMMHKMHGTKE